MSDVPKHPSRREALKLGLTAAAGFAVGCRLPLHAVESGQGTLITKPIPSTGERIPVIGLGTNRYSVTSAEELAARRAVLARMPELGATVVDTAPGYGRSEEVIGQLVSEIGNRDRLWIATKVTAPQNDVARGRQMLADSFQKLRTDRIELMQVHNLNGVEPMMPILREMKQEGKIRYIGVTTSSDRQYDALIALMQREPLDFIQVDYSIGNRSAGERVLPLAAERGMAVLLNVPFGGARGNAIGVMGQRPVPEWAAEFDARTWAQLFLKYNVSHPAVTAAIPGTTNVAHLEDNVGAARGRLPDEAMRRRIEQLFDAA
ncbi:MAG TPA: aldo/keto reductase [Gemmatimonadaceae bacterium]|nr:aldo/keto reductase [Gemmatimonadaceae bacterium]